VVAVLLAKTVILLNTAHTELGGGVVAWPTAARSRINLQPTKQYFHLRDEGFSLSLSLSLSLSSFLSWEQQHRRHLRVAVLRSWRGATTPPPFQVWRCGAR